MTAYYVDLGLDYDGTQVSPGGTAEETPWGAPTGLQRALKAAGATDVIYVRNAAVPTDNVDLTGMWKVPCTSTASLLITDLVTIDAAGENVTARVGQIETDDYIIVEYVSGGDLGATGTADTITSAPGGLDSTLDGTPSQPGLVIDTAFCADGTAAGQITVRGVASDWTTPEHAYLDCAGAVAYGLTITSPDYWKLEYLHFDDATTDCINVTANSDYWTLDHVRVSNADAYGIRGGQYLRYGNCRFCMADENASYGWQDSPANGSCAYCVWDHNLVGCSCGQTNITFHNCIFSNNTSHGLRIVGRAIRAYNCIMDGNDGSGVIVAYDTRTGVVIDHCRLTNNTTYGISCAVGDVDSSHIGDYNVFYGNGTASVSNFPSGANDHGPVGDTSITTVANRDVTADGYTNAATDDYSLTGTAILRREATTIGSMTSYLTAGIASAELAQADVGDVEEDVIYASGTLTGTFAVPDETKVYLNVQYGADGTEFTGTLKVPDESDVEYGVGYGDGSTEFTGSFVVPAEGDVEADVKYGALEEFTGTFVVPLEAVVATGEGYGEDGTEFTGSMGTTEAAGLIISSGVIYTR